MYIPVSPSTLEQGRDWLRRLGQGLRGMVETYGQAQLAQNQAQTQAGIDAVNWALRTGTGALDYAWNRPSGVGVSLTGHGAQFFGPRTFTAPQLQPPDVVTRRQPRRDSSTNQTTVRPRGTRLASRDDTVAAPGGSREPGDVGSSGRDLWDPNYIRFLIQMTPEDHPDMPYLRQRLRKAEERQRSQSGQSAAGSSQALTPSTLYRQWSTNLTQDDAARLVTYQPEYLVGYILNTLSPNANATGTAFYLNNADDLVDIAYLFYADDGTYQTDPLKIVDAVGNYIQARISTDPEGRQALNSARQYIARGVINALDPNQGEGTIGDIYRGAANTFPGYDRLSGDAVEMGLGAPDYYRDRVFAPAALALLHTPDQRAAFMAKVDQISNQWRQLRALGQTQDDFITYLIKNQYRDELLRQLGIMEGR